MRHLRHWGAVYILAVLVIGDLAELAVGMAATDFSGRPALTRAGSAQRR
jgi:hypothetical protein